MKRKTVRWRPEPIETIERKVHLALRGRVAPRRHATRRHIFDLDIGLRITTHLEMTPRGEQLHMSFRPHHHSAVTTIDDLTQLALTLGDNWAGSRTMTRAVVTDNTFHLVYE
jgi:hypothetical protein